MIRAVIQRLFRRPQRLSHVAPLREALTAPVLPTHRRIEPASDERIDRLPMHEALRKWRGVVR